MAVDAVDTGAGGSGVGRRLGSRFLSWRSVPIIGASVGVNVLSLAMPLAILQLYDRIIPNTAVETLTVLFLGVTIALVLEALLTYVRSSSIAWAGARFEHGLMTAMFARFLSADRSVIGDGGNGLHCERFGSVAKIKDFHAGQALGVAADIPFVCLFIGLIYIIGGWVAAIPVAIFIAFLALFAIRDIALKPLLRAADKVQIHRLNFELETLGRMTVIKGEALEAPMMRRYERLLRTSTTNEHAIATRAATTSAMSASLGGITMVAVAAGGAVAVIDGALSIGELAACTLLANRALQPLQRAFGIWTGYKKLALHNDHVDAGMTLPSARPGVARVLPRIKGGLVLNGIGVQYGSHQTPVLESVDLDVRPGESVGITGEAGSGKTTLLMVMAGMLRPDRGTIKLDGCKDPWGFSEESVLARIAYIPSRGTIFAGSLLDNITMFAEADPVAVDDPSMSDTDGDLTAPHLSNRDRIDRDRARAYRIADRLGLTALAGRLPNGFNTVIGPGSPYILPHGLVQRIAIARALFADPAIILFDAANTALDTSGDTLVREVLEEQKGLKTLIVVSQRPSLLRIVDRVYTLTDGHLVENEPPKPVSVLRPARRRTRS